MVKSSVICASRAGKTKLKHKHRRRSLQDRHIITHVVRARLLHQLLTHHRQSCSHSFQSRKRRSRDEQANTTPFFLIHIWRPVRSVDVQLGGQQIQLFVLSNLHIELSCLLFNRWTERIRDDNGRGQPMLLQSVDHVVGAISLRTTIPIWVCKDDTALP